MKKLIGNFFFASFFLASCASANAQATLPSNETTAAAATAPSESSPTSEPTIAPLPQPITAANAVNLTLASITDLDRESLADPQELWNAARWSPDGAYVVVETSYGFDTLDGATLELVYSADGYKPIEMLADGRVASLMGLDLVFVDPASGEAENQASLDQSEIVEVSLDGNWLAYVTGTNTIMLVNLGTDESNEITITRDYALTSIDYLNFLGDGSALAISGTDVLGHWPVTMINPDNESVKYEIFSYMPLVPYPGSNWYLYWNHKKMDDPGSLARTADSGTGLFTQTTFAARFGNNVYNEGTGRRRVTEGYAADLSFVGGIEEWAALYMGSSYETTEMFTTVFYSQPQAFLLFWNKDGENTATISQFEEGTVPNSVAFSPDGSTFLTTSDTGKVQLWTRDGSLVASAEYAGVTRAALSADGSLLALPRQNQVTITGSDDLAAVTEIAYPAPAIVGALNINSEVRFATENRLVVSIFSKSNAFSFFGGQYVTAIYDHETGALQRSLVDLSGCETSYDRTSILCSNAVNGSTQVIRVSDGSLLASFKPEGISFIRLSQNGLKLSSCHEGTDLITVQDLAGGANKTLNFPCEDVLFLPGDTTVLLADGTVVDVETGETARTFEFPEPYLEFPAAFFSPNGDFVVIGNHVYNLNDGSLLITLEGYETLYEGALADDGLTLLLNTDRGLEYWQSSP